MDITLAVALVLIVLLPAVLVGVLFVWAALKDGQEDRALQARLGIRRQNPTASPAEVESLLRHRLELARTL